MPLWQRTEGVKEKAFEPKGAESLELGDPCLALRALSETHSKSGWHPA